MTRLGQGKTLEMGKGTCLLVLLSAPACAGQVEHAASLEAALQTQRAAAALHHLDSAHAGAVPPLCMSNSKLFVSVDSK